MIVSICDALRSLVPTAGFSATYNEDNSLNKITWNSEIAQPTDAEVNAEVARLQAISDGNAYQRTRATAYEEVQEQLDQLYHDMTAGKLDATGEWHKAIKAVKDATPKP